MGDIETPAPAKEVVVQDETAETAADKNATEAATDADGSAGDEKLEEEIDECCCGLLKKRRPTRGCCGFELEERPDFSVWEKEDKQAAFIPLFFLVVGVIGAIIYFIDKERFEALAPPSDPSWYLGQVITTIILAIFWFPLGCLVWYLGVSVAITRKITHTTFLTLIPIIAVYGTPEIREVSFFSMVWKESVWGSFFQCIFITIIYCKPVRKWVPFFRIAFASVERTEDRPFALNWLLMQLTAGTAVAAPMLQWMIDEEKGILIFIPYLAVSLGDGLAEPVGKRWGKHKYQTSALFTQRKFTRSYEGSACVFFFTLVAVLISLSAMNRVELVLCILIVPISATLIEAKSMHTFDNHMMQLGIWFLLWLIFDVISPAIS